ncbi:MAG: c-type cytochrome [Acidobacteriota bacterium]
MAGTARKLVKIAGWALGSIVVLVGIIAIVLVIASNRMLAKTVTVPVSVAEIAIPEGDAVAIGRGKYLVDHVVGCNVCHGADFGGSAPVDAPMIGTLWAPNLTAGAGSVTKDFLTSDWLRAIRHGVAPDGRRLFLMPSADYVNFSDGDVSAIIAYIKSMPPVDRENRGIRLGPVGRALVVAHQMKFAFDEIDHLKRPPSAAPSVTAAWGEVLSGTCSGCHGPTYSGGKIPGGDPAWPPARNLTPDATGLKGWTFEQFSNAFRHGKRPDGTDLSIVMPWQQFAGMSDDDAHALWAFLQTLPARPLGNR